MNTPSSLFPAPKAALLVYRYISTGVLATFFAVWATETQAQEEGKTLEIKQLQVIFQNGLIRAKILRCLTWKNSNLTVTQEEWKTIYTCNHMQVIAEKWFSTQEIIAMDFAPGTEISSSEDDYVLLIQKIPTE